MDPPLPPTTSWAPSLSSLLISPSSSQSVGSLSCTSLSRNLSFNFALILSGSPPRVGEWRLQGCVLIACPSLHLDGLPSEDADPLLVSCCLHQHLLFSFLLVFGAQNPSPSEGEGSWQSVFPAQTCHENTFLSTALIELELFISSFSHISTLSLPFTLLISMIYFPVRLSLSGGISLVSLVLKKYPVVEGLASVN